MRTIASFDREETFKASKDVRGWDQCQAHGLGAICRHSALTALARQHAAGLISDARLAFRPRWSRWRRRHQARTRWHHYSARLAAAAAAHVTNGNQNKVTHCNQSAGTIPSQYAA